MFKCQGVEKIIKETENAKKLNQILSKKIKDNLLANVIFINPLEIIDQSCGKDIKSYLTCFRDSDHLSDKSSNELMEFLFKNYFITKKIVIIFIYFCYFSFSFFFKFPVCFILKNFPCHFTL